MTDANDGLEPGTGVDDASTPPAEPLKEPVADPASGVTATEPPTATPSQTPAPAAPAPAARPAPAAPAAASARRRRTWPSTLSRIVEFVFGVLQALLIIRILLLLLIANQDNDIVAGILSVTDPFVEPFRGMFQLDEITAQQGSVLDLAAVVALIAWTLLEALILALLRIFARSDTARA